MVEIGSKHKVVGGLHIPQMHWGEWLTEVQTWVLWSGGKQTPVLKNSGISVTGLSLSLQTDMKLNRIYKASVLGTGKQAEQNFMSWEKGNILETRRQLHVILGLLCTFSIYPTVTQEDSVSAKPFLSCWVEEVEIRIQGCWSIENL